jgi:hypothetical protein
MVRFPLSILLVTAGLAWGAQAGPDEAVPPAPAPAPAEAVPPAAPAAEPKAEPAVAATVKVIEGTVEWRPNVQSPWQGVQVGQQLAEGADIRTGFRAKCILDLSGSLVQVDSMTVIRVGELKRDKDTVRTRLYLKQGSTQSIVEKGGTKNDFAIVTPSATLSVRGTQGINCSFWPDMGGLFGLTGPGRISIQDLIGRVTGLGPGEWTNDQAVAALQYLSEIRLMALQQMAGLEVTGQFPFPQGPTFTPPQLTLPPGGNEQGGGGDVGGGGKTPSGWDDPCPP